MESVREIQSLIMREKEMGIADIYMGIDEYRPRSRL